MPLAYLYGRMTPVAGDLLNAKIVGNLNLAPTRTQVVGTYGYVEFVSALTADELASLDQYMLDAWGGSRIATDNTPSASVLCFGRSSDNSVWKLIEDNLGTVSSVKVL